MISNRIGEILIERGLIREADVAKALAYQNAYGGRIGTALLRLGAISEDDLLRALSDQLDVPILPREALSLIDPIVTAQMAAVTGGNIGWWVSKKALVYRVGDGPLVCVATDIVDPALREMVTRSFGTGATFALARQVDIEAALERVAASAIQTSELINSDDLDSVDALKELAEQAPVIDFLNRVFIEAIESRASDIHVEPAEGRFDVRMRTDGVLSTRQSAARNLFDAVATRIKLLSGMDIAERRLPQDGRQSIRFSGEDVDLRVSTLPSMHGESIVMRLLRKRQESPGLRALGMTEATLARFESLLRVPNGVILVTGPTGSGKSTTLYRALDMVRDGTLKIVTIEDPVEYEMTGVTQVQVKAEIGLTFATGLRAILRQDPNVVLVGEIRDGETASICAQAALTGHLVLSTLHTNSAAEAVSRLVDLGVEPFLVAATVRGLLAQRLVRQLCPDCSKPAEAEAFIAAEAILARAGASDLSRTPANWREPVGCKSCAMTGFRGRLGVFELIAITDEIHAAILEGAPGGKIEALSTRSGNPTMLLDGVSKARSGLTSVAEILRVTGDSGANMVFDRDLA